MMYRKQKVFGLLWWISFVIFITSGLGSLDAEPILEHKYFLESGERSSLLVVKDTVTLSGEIHSLELSVCMTKERRLRSISIELQCDSQFLPSGEIRWCISDETKLSMFGKSSQRPCAEGIQSTVSVLGNMEVFSKYLSEMSISGAVLELYSKQGAKQAVSIPAGFFALLGT